MKSLLRRAHSCALLAGTACAALHSAAPANAQNTTAPKERYYIGDGQIDLYSGSFKYSNMDISIGPPEGGMALTRYNQVRGSYGGSFGTDSAHSLEVRMYRQAIRLDSAGASQPDYQFTIVIGRTTKGFYWQRYSWQSQAVLTAVDGATLAVPSTTGGPPYVYTAADGTVINFDTLGVGHCNQAGYGAFCSQASSVTTAAGAKTMFEYDLVSDTRRLRLVRNNHGFGIGFDYNGVGSLDVSKACALNLAVHQASIAAPCPAGAPAATYTYGGDLATYTNPAGETTNYTISGGAILTIRSPGSSTNDLTVEYHPVSARVVKQTYANGAAWTYAYQQTASPYEEDSQLNVWTEVTSPLGNKVKHTFFSGGSSQPSEVKDELLRATTFAYIINNPHLVWKKFEPEGNETRYAYDARENVTETRRIAKPNSGIADIVSTAAYPATCASQKTCNKPLSTTDSRGGTTDYVYDAAHGGVLSATGPAVNGVRPQVRYTYGQKYAGVNNGGGIVQAATPMWVVVEEAQCMTAASCTGGADEVKTAYDWGTYQSGPLMLRGKVVDPGGLNLRTCYGYDARGNRISETEPKAGLQSCP
jgi:YD repeat-containing protein